MATQTRQKTVTQQTAPARESKSLPKPIHVPGTHEGNELVQTSGREPGRDDDAPSYRSARDSTSINPEREEPILPEMPNLPPA